VREGGRFDYTIRCRCCIVEMSKKIILMINPKIQSEIISIWDKYIADNKKLQDTKGNDLGNIDEKRIQAIKIIEIIIDDFLIGKIDLSEFKTDIDSYNKQNNLWGFTSIKGQMFFNLLLKTNDSDEQQKKLTKLLRESVSEPKDLADALHKIEALDKFCSAIFSKASDKRKAPNPGSVCYFLSYFWQVHDYTRWPIMYSSIIVSLTDIGLWKEPSSPKDAYDTFYKLNEEIKTILSSHTGNKITNWEAEHSFWNFRSVTAYPKTLKQKVEVSAPAIIASNQPVYKASFDIYNYIIPAVANLVALGNESEKSSSSKGATFEKIVSEIFRQLDFEVVVFGQGKGREPDMIIKNREDHTAFIVDAKAYSNGYVLSPGDERAIREYINTHSLKLQKEGLKKIGFIIVSNFFKTDFEVFINDITWNTDIKRFLLIESQALLHLVAYKNKDQLTLCNFIESLVNFGNLVTTQDVIQSFDDV
jgi:hypothetical protein